MTTKIVFILGKILSEDILGVREALKNVEGVDEFHLVYGKHDFIIKTSTIHFPEIVQRIKSLEYICRIKTLFTE